MHRFLSPAAAEAFAGVTPEQVRADLEHLDQTGIWPNGRLPSWLGRLDRLAGPRLATSQAEDQALRFLVDRAATVVDSEGRACRMEHLAGAYDLLIPEFGRPAGERLDVMVLVPVEEGE